MDYGDAQFAHVILSSTSLLFSWEKVFTKLCFTIHYLHLDLRLVKIVKYWDKPSAFVQIKTISKLLTEAGNRCSC